MFDEVISAYFTFFILKEPGDYESETFRVGKL